MGTPESGPPQAIGGVYGQHEALRYNDAEFEYEYDPLQTEDYYFTLDLTSDPRAAARAQAILDEGDEIQGSDENSPRVSPDHAGGRTPKSTTTGRFQVADLHSANPQIKLDGKLYTCDWSTDYGTQVFITEPGVAPSPRRPGNVLDVVGMSRARLKGQLTAAKSPLHTTHTPFAVDDAASNDITYLPEDSLLQGVLNPDQQWTRFAAARVNADSPIQEAQASFLERLSIIKAKKGDTDLVPVYGVKRYTAPANKEEIRKHALATEAKKPPRPTRPYKRRAPVGHFAMETRGSRKSSVGKGSGGQSLISPINTAPTVTPPTMVNSDAQRFSGVQPVPRGQDRVPQDDEVTAMDVTPQTGVVESASEPP